MTQKYNDPAGGTASTVGDTKQTFMRRKKSIIEAKDLMFFSPLSKSENMPKHYGKEINVYEYVPLIDDRNVNNQGLDAAGAVYANGNLWGSSKDIGKFTSSFPALGEGAERVNRVGFTRISRKATLQQAGFFYEYTEDSLNFDDDNELKAHCEREALHGAIKLNEAIIGVDLLNGAGIIQYTGIATQDSEVTGETGAIPSLVDYADLQHLRVALDDNKTPRSTKIITGSNLSDTKVVPASRYMYVGTELINMLRDMLDTHGKPAFTDVEHYADGAKGTIMTGEEGKISGFRVIVNPEMMHWAGAGGAVTNDDGYDNDGSNYNIYPMLVVGQDSFVTVGFQSNGKEKFKMMSAKPGQYPSKTDPFGKEGFESISFWYATLILRPERIAVIKTLATT